MSIRTRLVAAAAVGLLVVSCASGERPVRNVNPGRHPNLAAAQDFCQRAFDRIVTAQQENEWDMNGHAQRAKDLLSQASDEIKAAALSANHHH